MTDAKERTQRRVYVLPTELVERIIAFQEAMALPSEVEAARRLLDEALKHRDDWEAIARRFQQRMKETRILSDIAKEILIGHPLVKSVDLSSTSIRFYLTTGEDVVIFSDATIGCTDRHKTQYFMNRDGEIVRDTLPF